MDLYDLLDTLPGLNGLSKKLSKFWSVTYLYLLYLLYYFSDNLYFFRDHSLFIDLKHKPLFRLKTTIFRQNMPKIFQKSEIKTISQNNSIYS